MSRFKLIILVVVTALSPMVTHAQTSEVKVNVLAGALTIFNPSFEIGFGRASAVTMDYVGAYAEENFMNSGYPFLLSMGLLGYRHYLLNDDHKGFFVGADVGFDQFRMNKNIIPFVVNDHDSGYDVGYGSLIGVTVGYKYSISARFNIEASVSGGWHLAQHERYNNDGERQIEFNATGEWTPYKAGIYISYLFGASTSTR